MNNKHLYITLIQITVFSLIGKFLGFMREMLLSYYYGAGSESDAYLLAISTAGIFLGWMGTLAIIHTPVYSEITVKKGDKTADLFSNQLLIIIICLGLLCVFIINIFSRTIVELIAPGFDDGQLTLASVFLKWAAIGIFLNAISQVIISEMNCRERYSSANSTNMILSAVQMIVIIHGGIVGDIMILRFAVPFSAAIQMAILAVLLFRTGHSFLLDFPFLGDFKKFFVLILPIFVSSLMDEINAFVDKMFGSNLDSGSISALNYAHLIKQLFFYVFTTAIVTIIYPRISKNIANENSNKFNSEIAVSLDYMSVSFSFITIFLFVFSKPIVEITYMRGEFDSTAVSLTSESLQMYAMALMPLAIREVMIKAFQALQDTKVNMYVGIVSVLSNILFNVILVRFLAHRGLALSTSIAAYITVPILCILLNKKSGFDRIKEFLASWGKSLIGAAASVAISYFVFRNYFVNGNSVFINKLLYLCLAGVMAVSIYFLILLIERVPLVERIAKHFIARKRG